MTTLTAAPAPEPNDDNAAETGRLTARGDWAGLLRWWIANDYAPARIEAIQLLRNTPDFAGGFGVELAEWVGAVPEVAEVTPGLPAEEIRTLLSEEQRMSLNVVAHASVARMYDRYHETLEQRRHATAAGIAAFEHIFSCAEYLVDGPLMLESAFRLSLGKFETGDYRGAVNALARASSLLRGSISSRRMALLGRLAPNIWCLCVSLETCSKWVEAEAGLEAALAIFGELALEKPAVYNIWIIRLLSRLGNVQINLGKIEITEANCMAARSMFFKMDLEQRLVHRHELAITLNDLAVAQWVLKKLEAAEVNLESELAIWSELSAETPLVYRGEVARTLYVLGDVQFECKKLEAAHRSWELALVISSILALERPDEHLPNIAKRLCDLGAVQSELQKLELAEASYKASLVIFLELDSKHPGIYSTDLAMTLLEVGGMQRRMKKLEAAENSLSAALRIYRKMSQSNPELYRYKEAFTLANLGCLQIDLGKPELAEASLEAAIVIYRLPLTGNAPPAMRKSELAGVLSNLGAAQMGQKKLEAASVSFEAANVVWRELASQEPGAYRANWAQGLHSLGISQRQLKLLDEAASSFLVATMLLIEPVEEALAKYRLLIVKIFQDLAAVLVDLHMPDMAEISLAAAVAVCCEVERPEILKEMSIFMCLSEMAVLLKLTDRDFYKPNLAELSAETVLVIRKVEKIRSGEFQAALAILVTNLGATLAMQGKAEVAEAALSAALGIARNLAEAQMKHWQSNLAFTLQKLGFVQRLLAKPKAAEVSFTEACILYDDDAERSSDANIDERSGAHANLAELLRVDNPELGWPDYGRAQRSLGIACRLRERFRGKFRDEQHRRRVLAESAGLFELYVRNSVELWLESCRKGRPDGSVLSEALWAAEATRSRQLLDRLSIAGLTPARLTPEVDAILRDLDEKLTAARRRRAHELGMRPEGDFDGGPGEPARWLKMGSQAPDPRWEKVEQVERELAELEAAKVEVIAKLRASDPDATPEPTVPAEDFTTIRGAVPTDIPTAFLEYVIGREESFALLALADGMMVPVKLPGLRGAEAAALATEWFVGYARAKDRYREKKKEDLRAFSRFVAHWSATQATVLPKVFAAALAPVIEEIERRGLNVERLVISPNQVLHVFPLHACRLPSGKLLGEAYEVSYTPSFSMLHRCTERKRAGEYRLVLLDDPHDPCRRGRSLPFTQAETGMVQRRLSGAMTPTCLPGTEATRRSLIAAAESARVLHYSGHASFDGSDPLQSELELSGEPLTLADVFSKVILRNNALTVLNGCESGLLRPDDLDDYVSFTTGFLFAGAPCVISTLWSVPDLPSALIMDAFYTQWMEGVAPAAALRAAQKTVRELRKGAEIEKAVDNLAPGSPNPELRKHAAAYVKRVCGGRDQPFADPVHWAAFTCNGLGFRRLQ